MKARDLSEQIRYIQIETGTLCNYRCVYCPVSYAPRKIYYMPLQQIEKIVRELEHFPNIERIYLNGYDEPTLNPQLVTIVRMLAHLPGKIVLLTNGTFLKPVLVDDLTNTGASIEFDIHLAAVNPQDFRRTHRSDALRIVLRNIEYLKTYARIRRIEVHITRMGRGDERDDRVFQEMQAYFANTPFDIRRKFPNDRAGLLDNEYKSNIYNRTLGGCWLANRPVEWIHINATGKATLCPQDYYEEYIIGDVNQQSLMGIIASGARHTYQQWTRGEIEAPTDYICRRCIFAISQETEKFATDKGAAYTFLR